MIWVRQANMYDLLEISECNMMGMVENYQQKYYYYHLLSWPQLTRVMIGSTQICGYVLSKLEDDNERCGHITSIGIQRHYRMLGMASTMLGQTHKIFSTVFQCIKVFLFVRFTNIAAQMMYQHKLNYKVVELHKEYYADREDAFLMCCDID